MTLSVLAGAKTQTGQTAPKKDPVLSKLELKFFPLSDKHKRRFQELISIKGDIVPFDKHKKGRRCHGGSSSSSTAHRPRAPSSTIFRGALATRRG